MKKTILVWLLIWMANRIPAQVPTQAEMERMMKEANNALKNIDPETKKMMDGLGMTRVIPVRDPQRIASLHKPLLTSATLPVFISKIHSAVIARLPATVKTTGEQVYQAVKSKNNSPAAIANAATGLWMTGNSSISLYLMGKACLDDPGNTDNLNNYAAFLTMTGAEQAAIPILMNLNLRFPGNSTILNNLGQAWFGLGELDNASKYLDSAILFYAVHSQANFTRCLIEETKGRKSAAIEAMKKSIRNTYSKEKDNRLRELGHELNDKDLDWNFPIPVDALGLQRFFTPKYPMNTAETVRLEEEWKAFRIECREARQVWDNKNKKLYPEKEIQVAEEQQRLINAVINKQRVSSTVLVPFYHSKAIKKLIYLQNDKDGSIEYNRIKVMQDKAVAEQEAARLEKEMNEELNRTMSKIHVETIKGDGGISEEEYCNIYNGIVNKYLPRVNKLLYESQLQYLEFMRKYLNNMAYFNMFTMDELSFEIFKNGAKAGWLENLNGSKVKFWHCPYFKKQPEEIQAGKTLPDFDDINCKREVEFYFYSSTITIRCSRMTSQIDLPFLQASLTENLNNNEIIRGSVEVGVSKKLEMGKGPLKGEVKGEVVVGVEIDKTGITDVVIKGSVKAEAGSDVITSDTETLWISEPSVTIGSAEGRYGWNSGGSLEGKGILKGLKL